MKNIYFKVFVLLLVSINTYSQVPSYVPTNGLVGWWPFNGNANDESGNGINGTVNGATLTTDRNGISNTAYSISNINNGINTNFNGILGVHDRTTSVWVYVTNNNGVIGLFAYGSGGNGGEWSQYLMNFSGSIYAVIDNSNSQIAYQPSLTLNTWHNYVATYSSVDGYKTSSIKIYIDGVRLTDIQYNYNGEQILNTKTGILKFGYTGESIQVPLKIDDIGFWNRALTQQEITDLYNSQTCANPIATITPQGSTTFCQGGSVNLNASTGTNYTFEWYKNGQIINGATTGVYQATTSGNYTVKVIDGACNTTSSATTVTVNAIPSNGVTVNGNTTFCQGGSTTLTAQGTGSYLWSNGATTQSINATQTGNYSLVVTQNGCSATSSQTAITVNPLPTATITPQGNTTFCQGGFVTLVASGGSTYQWNSGAQTASISANQAGTFTVNVFNQFNCQASASQVVTVNANPTVTLNALNNVVYKTSSPIQLVGNPNGGTYSGEAVSGSIFTPANATLGRKTISYNYTSQQGCSGSASQTTIVADTVGNVCSTYDTLRIKVKFTAGLYANTTNTVKFYPNPTNDILFIDNGNYQAMSGYTIKIVSLTGAIIYNQPITSQQVQISMNQFATKGLYIAQIIDSNNAIVDSKKIVLE